jgi:hypothetical protein
MNIIYEGQTNAYNVPDDLVAEARDYFARMDADMDRGWQMSRDWVDDLDAEQRCQVAADRILTAIETDNDRLLMLMCAYILYKMPGVTGVHIDNTGDMNETAIIMGHDEGRPLGPIFG